MTKTCFLISLFLVLSCVAIKGERDSRVDSLLTLCNTVENTPEHVKLLNQVSAIYSDQATNAAKDSALIYSTMAINVARNIDDKAGLAAALYDLGQFYVGVASEPAKATQYLLESLELFTELNIKSGVSKCHMQLGLISYILQYFEDAIKNFHLSLDAMENPTSNYLMAITYTEIDSFEQEKHFFTRAISNYSDLNRPQRLAECYLYLGRLYLKTGDLDSAFHYVNRALEGRRTLNDSVLLVRPWAFLSEVYLESGDVANAIRFAELSYEVESNKTDRQPDEISLIQASRILSKAYVFKGNYKKAYFFLDLYNTENNRYSKGSTKQKVADMQSMFEFEQTLNLQKVRQQKDKEIAQQQIAKEKILRNSFLIGSALLLLLLIVLYNRFNIKKRAVSALRDLNEVITSEKKRSDELLLNILPEETANELKQKGYADAKQIDYVSVLFTDFKGFTAMSEQLSAKELVEDLHACFSEFDRICQQYGIEKIKTIGDAYMAAGGLPVPNQTHANDVVKAALDMVNVVESGKAKKIARNQPFFEIRIGVHTGPVVAGIVGVKKFQYDIWGDTVNTASRMESNGQTGQVNISQATYELLKNDPTLSFENRGQIDVKGKGAMEMYFVTSRTAKSIPIHSTPHRL